MVISQTTRYTFPVSLTGLGVFLLKDTRKSTGKASLNSVDGHYDGFDFLGKKSTFEAKLTCVQL